MIISVISPHINNNGTTTVASLVALELGARGKKTCLTHSATKSNSMLRYFGLDETEQDKTANPARMVKMIKEGILKSENISEYCRAVNNTVEIYSANDATFSDEDMLYALEFMVKGFPHDFIVFDIDVDDLESEANKITISNSDFIIVVMEQGIKDINAFIKSFKGTWKLIGKKPMMMVVNRYNQAAGKINDLPTEVGIKEVKKGNSWLPLHYNPYIIKYENAGNLPALHRAMKTNDPRIIEIGSDVRNIVNRIMKFRTAKRLGYIPKEDGENSDSPKSEN